MATFRFQDNPQKNPRKLLDLMLGALEGHRLCMAGLTRWRTLASDCVAPSAASVPDEAQDKGVVEGSREKYERMLGLQVGLAEDRFSVSFVICTIAGT